MNKPSAQRRILNLPVTPLAAVLAVIALFTVARLILAGTIGMGVDEAYTVGVAHDLSLSYFDHPPLQFWIVHSYQSLFGDGRFVRLPFIALFAGSCWLLYQLTRRLFGAEAGMLAVFALNCSAVFTLANGGWVLPDGPLIFSMLAASLVLARRFFPEGQEKPSPWAAWLVAGFWIGVGGLSKYQIVLFAIGLLIYLLSTPARRKELLHPAPWLGAAVALLVVMPVIIWNIQNDWVSIRFQASRGAAITGLHIGNLFGNIGGQILWMLPWIFVPLAIASWQALRGGRASERSWFCLCLALPIVATFTIIPIWGDRGLPHWQMPGWLMLFPVLGHYLSRLADAARVRRWAIASGILIVALVALLAAQSVTGYARVLFPRAFTKDPTLESFEWNQLPPELAARGLLSRPGVFIITNNWTFAGKIDLALKGTLPIVIFRGEHKHYDFRFDPRSFVGRDAIVIGRVDSVVGIDNDLKPYFESIEDLPSFALGRAHMHEIELRILLAHTLKRPLPAQFRRW